MSAGENGSNLLLPSASPLILVRVSSPRAEAIHFRKEKRVWRNCLDMQMLRGNTPTTRSIQYLKITLSLKY